MNKPGCFYKLVIGQQSNRIHFSLSSVYYTDITRSIVSVGPLFNQEGEIPSRVSRKAQIPIDFIASTKFYLILTVWQSIYAKCKVCLNKISKQPMQFNFSYV